jgi:DNA-binding response OmpR family regulator
LDGEKLRILVVEDERKLAAVIEGGLEEQGYAVDVAHDGADALAKAEGEPYDLVVLDLMLPNIDGLTVCARLRAEQRNMPVLMLTARDGVDDRVRGLDAGADDYLTKPFAFRELLARVRALLRRDALSKEPVLSLADLKMNTVTHEVWRGGVKVDLTSKEYALLEYFMRNPNRSLSRIEIAEHIWDYNFASMSNVIDVYVRYLRRKLNDDGKAPMLRPVRGMGYELAVEDK